MYIDILYQLDPLVSLIFINYSIWQLIWTAQLYDLNQNSQFVFLTIFTRFQFFLN